MNEVGCNVNRSSYATAYTAEDIIFETREQLTEMFHGDDCKNSVFTANITSGLNVLLKGLLKSKDSCPGIFDGTQCGYASITAVT